MTELEVKENTFYVLTVKQGESKMITLHNDMDSPILKVKEHLKSGASPNDIDLMTVEIEEENFRIKGVPWSEIAVKLIKEA